MVSRHLTRRTRNSYQGQRTASPSARAASWRALPSGRGVKVQAIVGATLERAKGTEQVRNAIRRLRCGQRVVVSGTPTWADRPTRWARWREKRRQLRDGGARAASA